MDVFAGACPNVELTLAVEGTADCPNEDDSLVFAAKLKTPAAVVFGILLDDVIPKIPVLAVVPVDATVFVPPVLPNEMPEFDGAKLNDVVLGDCETVAEANVPNERIEDAEVAATFDTALEYVGNVGRVFAGGPALNWNGALLVVDLVGSTLN